LHDAVKACDVTESARPAAQLNRWLLRAVGHIRYAPQGKRIRPLCQAVEPLPARGFVTCEYIRTKVPASWLVLIGQRIACGCGMPGTPISGLWMRGWNGEPWGRKAPTKAGKTQDGGARTSSFSVVVTSPSRETALRNAIRPCRHRRAAHAATYADWGAFPIGDNHCDQAGSRDAVGRRATMLPESSDALLMNEILRWSVPVATWRPEVT
jgi:hypothetical protein